MLADDLGISTARAADGSQWIGLRGELDVYSAPRLKEVVQRLIREGYTRIRVDLGNLRFVDSSGLGILVQLHKAVAAQGGALEIGGANASVHRVFEIAGLDRIVTICELGPYQEPGA